MVLGEELSLVIGEVTGGARLISLEPNSFNFNGSVGSFNGESIDFSSPTGLERAIGV
jgi:hypothetical protein